MHKTTRKGESKPNVTIPGVTPGTYGVSINVYIAAGFQQVDSRLERADAIRRRLSKAIVAAGAFRDDVLEVTVAERIVTADGKAGWAHSSIPIRPGEPHRRKPSHGELEAIRTLAEQYTKQARRLSDRFAESALAELLQDDAESAVLEDDLLSHDGWTIEDLPTGEAPGRPLLSTESETRKCLSRVAPLLDLHHAIKAGRHRNPDQTRLYRALPNALHHLSARTAARSLSVAPRTVANIKSLGDPAVAEVLEELRALRVELAGVREDSAETRRLVVDAAERIRSQFPTDGEISSAVEELISAATA